MAVDLDDLYDEMARGRIYECSLRGSGKWQIDGFQSGETIYIDPRPAVLETVLHELLHRRKPRWTERSVGIAARNMAVRMDEATKAKWWKAYRQIRKIGRPVDVEE